MRRKEEAKSTQRRPPTCKLGVLFLRFFVFSVLIFVTHKFFSLDPQNQEVSVEKIKEAPCTEAGLVVGASTSLASLGSALPQAEKLKLAHKLLTVSS